MFDPEWLEWYGKNVHELILMLDSWGMEFEKDAQGRFKRKPGRGHREAVVFPGYKMQKKLRGILEKLGVVIVDRVMITELLASDGHVAGATGFNVRTGQFYVFEAKNTVLSTGACSFKGQYHGQDMVSGEGNDMALRVGAEFTNMEFANTYNADLRSKKIRESILDDFPGLGAVRRAALLEHFGDIDRLRELGYPITAFKGPDGGYRLDAG